MPKRPFQHQLEDESRTAFRAILPIPWVFRDAQPDYGIDGEVEIFNSEGKATGQLFKVQLKATNEPDLSRALAISLSLDTCDYYCSLDLPVLIARYHKPTSKFYVRWFHTFDPYYGKGEINITFKFSSDDLWNEETPKKLVREIETIQVLRSPRLALPLALSLVVNEDLIHGVPAYQIVLAIRKAATRLPGVLIISHTSSPQAHSIVITNDQVAISLGGIPSFTLHTSKVPLEGDVLSYFPYDVLLGVALALDKLGHSNTAARLITEYAPHCSIRKIAKVGFRLAFCLARAQRITEALELSEALFEKKDSPITSQLLMLPALAQNDSLSAGERDFSMRYMKRRIEKAEDAKDQTLAALAHYNLGNYIRRSHPRSAIQHYKKAAEHDPDYSKRAYYWAELAGIMFESRRYKHAISYYQRAIDLGESERCRPLLADSLMFAGNFRRSQEEFEAYISEFDRADSEWRLKTWALQQLRGMLKFDEQKRQTSTALKVFSVYESHPPEDLRQKLIEVLNYDALCSLAWFNLGVLENQSQNTEAAFFAFLMAALTCRDDVEAWLNVIVIGMNLSRLHFLLINIITTAYSANGERLLDQAAAFVETQPQGFPKTEFVKILSELLSLLPKKRESVEMRILGKNSTYHTIPIRQPERDS